MHGAPGPWRGREGVRRPLIGRSGRRVTWPRDDATPWTHAPVVCSERERARQHGDDAICHVFDRLTGLGVGFGVRGGGKMLAGACL